MSNTVFGPYSKTAWSDGVTALNQTHLNNLEGQALTAINTLNADFSGSFVHSGITCARNGVTLNQLDVATGIAYLAMSDLTVAKIAVGPSSAGQFVTVTPSTTYYLFLKNDGTWQWSTTSTASNAIPIAQATTDGSSNIATVTDVRASNGGPGIAYRVARALNVSVTSTTNQVLISYAPAVDGHYRVSGAFRLNNGTSGQLVHFGMTWWDPNGPTGASQALTVNSGGASQTLVPLDGAAGHSLVNGAYAAFSEVINATAASGHLITVNYQDPANTPNDVVSAFIERVG